jgi:hypothetical protein
VGADQVHEQVLGVLAGLDPIDVATVVPGVVPGPAPAPLSVEHPAQPQVPLVGQPEPCGHAAQVQAAVSTVRYPEAIKAPL